MAVFFVAFIVYLYTLFPSCAPYRDTGEMVSMAHTLGVAHPPGYPLYVLLSKLWMVLVPFGSEAFRMNVLSALAGALTVYLLYRALALLTGEKLVSAGAALVFGFSYLQWYLALVSEMYTLNTLFAAALVYYMVRLSREFDGRELIFAGFIFGLGLGNRMDLLMAGPGAALLLWFLRGRLDAKTAALAALAAAAGFTVFLYLPLRSSLFPLLDWNHPASLEKLWGTLTRKTHGGTLDLISEGYAKGANFPETIAFYFGHLWTGFAYAGLPAAVLGAYSLWKREKPLALSAGLAWAVSGPVFIYMANMPPNTHALAILEAHFLLPNLFAAVFMAEGFCFLKRRFEGAAVPAAVVLLAAVNLAQHAPELNKRWNLFAYDYAKNVFRSLPPRSVCVLKKDVQIFAIWQRQYVEGDRPDLAVIPQGLSNSEWFRKPWAALHPGAVISRATTAEEWKVLADANASPVYFTGDCDYPGAPGYSEEPDGLVYRMAKGAKNPTGGVLLEHIYAYRGDYDYDAYREFFTPDLIENYAKAWMQYGLYRMRAGDYSRAIASFARTLRLQPLMPMAANFAAYAYYEQGKYGEATSAFEEAVRQHEAYIALAVRYKTFEDVVNRLRNDLSGALVSLGVCYERLNEPDRSIECYSRAIDAYPSNARAYFNRAVIYWKRGDWQKVVSDLQAAVSIDPNFKEAAYYLQQARARTGR